MALDRFMIKGAPTCRIVYPSGLFEKKPVKGSNGDPKYSAVILIPKSDEEKVKQVMERYMEAFEDLKAKKYTGKTPDTLEDKNNALLDGDKWADKEEGKEAFRGYLVLKVASKNFRPLVTDMQKRIILNGVPINGLNVEQMSDEMLEDGDYVLCNVSFWTYNKPTGKGIGANVHAVARVKEGEHIAGVSTNVDDYLDLSEYV